MKNYLAILFCMAGTHSWAQVSFFQENMGSPAANTIISWYTGWQNPPPVNFVSTSVPETEVRNTAASAGYTGASGAGNVFFTNIPGRDLIISGINSSGYININLSFGHYKNTTVGNNELSIEVSADGVNYTALSYSRPVGTGSTGWLLVNPSGLIPATSNLFIRFAQNSSLTQFRVDDIVLSGIPNAMPVHFTGIRANAQSGGILVGWSNLAETGVLHYSVERSTDGINFKTMGTVPAKHNLGAAADYNWLDSIPAPSLNLYRIRSLEIDGKTVYSTIARVELQGSVRLRLYPNPVIGSQITIQAELPRGSYRVGICNVGGQQLYSGIMIHRGGLTTQLIELPELSAGLYFLQLGNISREFVVR